MKVIKVTKEYFQTEEEKVYFFEPLEKEISVEDMQKIVDANEKLVNARDLHRQAEAMLAEARKKKELKDAKD